MNKSNLVKNFLIESNCIEGVFDSKSHNYALEAWEYLVTQNELTEKNLLETHRILMRNHITTGDGLGQWRRLEVTIDGRLGLQFKLIPKAMENLIKKINLHKNSDEQAIQQFHVQFERIHPFVDGNGRTGRILMNWQRDKVGLPILVIWNKEKQAYYDWFNPKIAIDL